MESIFIFKNRSDAEAFIAIINAELGIPNDENSDTRTYCDAEQMEDGRWSVVRDSVTNNLAYIINGLTDSD